MELVVASLEDLQAQLAAGFERLVADAPLSCALSGGPTALLFLTALRTARPDWSRVALFFTDERAGGMDDAGSNAALTHRMLVGPLAGSGPRLFPMPGGVDLDEAASEYDALLDRELGGAPLDLAILGVGEDGHVAGLFPGHAALEHQTRVVAVPDAPRPPYQRLTLTLPFLMSSTRIWVVAVGERKRPLVQAAVSRRGGQTPFDMLLRHAADVTLFTDQPLRRG